MNHRHTVAVTLINSVYVHSQET